MDPVKVPTQSESARGHRNDRFVPVPAKPRRYSRGVLWADRAGVSEPDFSRLSLMRAMERKNRG